MNSLRFVTKRNFASKTYQNQNNIPRFPIPPLQETLNRFKKSIQPLLNEKEHAKYSEVIDDFGKRDGEVLNKILLETDKESSHNWMDGFWQSMYLDLRCPMPINVNPWLTLGDDPNPVKNKSQILKTASLLHSAAKFSLLLRNEELEPDVIQNTPLCMNGFTQILGGTRVPKHGRDEYTVSPKSNHVTVLCNNLFYKLPIIEDNGDLVPEEKIAQGLQAIKVHAKKNFLSAESLFPFGLMTTEDRDVWASVKQKVMNLTTENKKNVQEIDSALFIVCLDDTKPGDSLQVEKNAFFLNSNRYYDKLQMIITETGDASFNMEHTAYDGQVLYRFLHDIYNDSIKHQPLNPNYSTLPKPQHLPIKANDEIRSAITKAIHNFNMFVSTTEVQEMIFNDFGKERIKNYKMSPDAFFQIAAQIATFRTKGELVSTYESSSVRNFKHGRTETIRSLTNEMKDFVLKFEGSSASSQEKLEAAKKAALRHVEVVKDSKSGKGVDRHLQGLYWTALQKRSRISDFSIPPFFTEGGNYSNFMSNKLSTSNVGGGFAGIRSFGFGPVHSEGLGLGYMINDDSLPYTITSFDGKASEWKENMNKSLRDLSAFLEKAK